MRQMLRQSAPSKALCSMSGGKEEWRYMCEAMEGIKTEGKAEGIVKGEVRGKREAMLTTAKRMLKDGFLALKDVARYSGLSLAQVNKLQASMV